MSVETKRGHAEKKNKLQLAKKEFTRAKAMRELANGADHTEARFTSHKNHHVRYYAWQLAGAAVPESEAARKDLLDALTKGRTVSGKLSMAIRFGLTEQHEEYKAA